MHRTAFIVVLGLLFVSHIAQAEEPGPLDCPHCGTWTINAASPSGATGEQIVVSTDRISLPTCGEFDAELKEQKSSIQDQRRTYQATLQLKPGQPDLLCSVNAGETLRLQITVSVGYHADGGLGEFNVYKAQELVPVFSANAWNFSRDDPCDSGSAFGSAACLQYANAKVIKALAYESYSASSGKSSGNQFNAARYAALTMNFCAAREANNGGGSWPYVWALDCQSGHLQTKLSELRRWLACKAATKRSTCKPISETFDRSPKKEQ